ncbi:MAG: glycerophosphodiester phosphodiesterase family protein [Rhodospirillales bacterium]|nr:glycerophosphodiester phosphodiesterase family protein [Rhodospirillales bacterium]MDH3919996.1 glycerophosphodiester phosphodiesterase family protein [Rhodospirillales bacterium]MDH3969798.1 glycerophosphodiester phosphodiesterase family protein [Rhodospirillales bacterium]
MRLITTTLAIAVLLAALPAPRALADSQSVQLGPRPFYLVDQMDEGALKTKLQQCATRQFKKTDFSIGHRGAALQFPEHTKESYEAAARMGAGILECDVTFTSDGELVCRHAQCDLHTTTDILARPALAAKCSQPFVPADPAAGTTASARCCASDITLAEFKTLCGKMDASDRNATTVEAFLGGTANWRTDLYATCATVLSHAESIELFDSLDRKFTPELKSGNAADIAAVFGSQEAYAQAMIDEYKEAGIKPQNVWAQSFNPDDVLYWINNEPDFGKQAVFLDSSPIPHPDPGPFLRGLADQGVNIVAPPMPMLLALDGDDKIVPSDYAHAARQAGLDIITWTLERSGRIVEEVLEGRGSAFYYQTTLGGLSNDGDIMVTLDVLAQDVGILGIFSDWPATVTYYANCTNP